MIDMKTEYTTRSGQEVHLSEIFEGRVYGRIKNNTEWIAHSWLVEDRINAQVQLWQDLIPKPETVSGWVNIYKARISETECIGSEVHETKDSALAAGHHLYKIACLPIKFTVGEGLDNV